MDSTPLTRWSDLTAPIFEAIDAYAESQESDAVLAINVHRAANRLAVALEDASELPEDVRMTGYWVVGTFHWCRYQAQRGTVSGVRERREAIRWFEFLEGEDPVLQSLRPPSRVGYLLAESDVAVRRFLSLDDEARDLLGAAENNEDLVLLHEGVELLRPAIAAAPSDADALPHAWEGLGMAWQLWWSNTADTTALDEAIAAYRRSAVASLPTDPARADRYQALYALLHLRLEERGSQSDLDQAVGTLRTAVAALTEADARKPGWVIGLARDLLAQSHRDNTLEPVEEARTLLTEDVVSASHATPVGGKQLFELLASVYQRGGELTGDSVALAAAAQFRAAADGFL